MYLILISLISANISYDCELVSGNNDYTVSLFYDKACENCDHLISFLEEIDSRLERNEKNITIRYKNCDTCNCKSDSIVKFPTIKITQRGNELMRIDGKREFNEILEAIIKSSGFDRVIFTKNIKAHPGHVVKLKERDFFSGFSGPWIILFYGKLTDKKRELVFKIAQEYTNILNVGEIDGNTSPVLVRRFSLGYLPSIVALYDGLIVGYNAQDTIEDLKGFVEYLIKPSFESLTLDELEKMEAPNGLKHPIFIVFYKNVNIANEYYRGIAHEYKFRSTIYKSNDENLLKKSNINLDDADLKLVLYKNKMYHVSPYDATKNNKILEWIWHSHYPLVTRLNNDDFYAIMHGLKPVILLLTHSEDFVEEFEKASEKNHNGMPFSDFIFSTIDVSKYPLFIPSLVPNIKVPWIVIYNPVTQLFYTESMKVTKEKVGPVVDKLIEKYNSEKLSRYPFKRFPLKKIMMVVVLIGCGLYFIKHKMMDRRLKLVEI